MIFLKKDIVNSVILTLTENEVTYSGEYYLNITNTQSHNVVSDIYLYDISTNPDRYNEFNVVLVEDNNFTGYTYDDVTYTTTIYNLISGVYDYSATDLDSLELEIGRIRIETDTDPVMGTYSPTIKEIIYKKED